jgi:hypothetical protein
VKLHAREVLPPRVGPQDCGFARRRKLILGSELERAVRVQEDLLVGAPMERRTEFAAANLQAESYLERRTVGWVALGVAHVTSGITANVLTSRWPTAFSRATSSILTYKVHRAQWQFGCRSQC